MAAAVAPSSAAPREGPAAGPFGPLSMKLLLDKQALKVGGVDVAANTIKSHDRVAGACLCHPDARRRRRRRRRARARARRGA